MGLEKIEYPPLPLVEISTLAVQGQTKLPGGLQIKWGSYSLTTNQTKAYDFTDNGLTDFDNACLQVFPTYGSTAHWQDTCGVTAKSTTGFSVKNNSNFTNTVAWLAIGY